MANPTPFSLCNSKSSEKTTVKGGLRRRGKKVGGWAEDDGVEVAAADELYSSVTGPVRFSRLAFRVVPRCV